MLRNGPKPMVLQKEYQRETRVVSILRTGGTSTLAIKIMATLTTFSTILKYWHGFAMPDYARSLRLIILSEEKLLVANNQIFSIGKNYALHKNKRIRGLCSS